MGLMLNLKNMMLGADYEDEDEFLDDEEMEEVHETIKNRPKQKTEYEQSSKKQRESNVLNLPGATNVQDPTNDVIISHPKTTSDASLICSKFKESSICIVDLEGVDKDSAQRIADILSGAVYVLEGNIERITNNVFVMTPRSCSVSNELKEQIKSNNFGSSIFPWLSNAK
jgi:cell division inhibitor SepF